MSDRVNRGSIGAPPRGGSAGGARPAADGRGFAAPIDDAHLQPDGFLGIPELSFQRAVVRAAIDVRAASIPLKEPG